MTGWSAQTGHDAAATLFRLDGRVALVTGASQGLGLEMSAALASAGATVLINSRVRSKAQRIADEFAGAGLSAEPLVFDPADEEEMSRALSAIEARHGKLDVLIANAAARHRAAFSDIEPGDFRNLIETNLSSVYAMCWRAMPLLRAGDHGRIILISSVSAHGAPTGDAAYSTSKAGIEALMRAIAVECGPMGVTCNAIAPGPFRTEVNQAESVEVVNAIKSRVPLQRFGEPSELAGTALFLASDAASYLNGHSIVVDGGMTARV